MLIERSRIFIAGAGLAGSLLALFLAKRGAEVEVYEARDDIREGEGAGGRSINLALSDRGIAALRKVGMDKFMLAASIPMYGRMIHSPSGATKLLPYSGRTGEYINSISRAGLNAALIDAAEEASGVNFHFNEPCKRYVLPEKKLELASGRTLSAETLIAADGAGSAIRRGLEHDVEGFSSRSEFLGHGYKELVIPATSAGNFQLEKNALHIWPRHKFMMIALPNLDGSFTCTLFLAKSSEAGSSEASFDSLEHEKELVEFFEREFADALPLMPTLVEDFFSNPTGDLGTVICSPWHADGRVLLLGDAAHAMVPFYGQGMNCAFEDVRYLDLLLDEYSTWTEVFDRFESERKPNADAIQRMAIDNFFEMRDKVADPIFQKKRELETTLEHTYDDYFSKYSMVTFREDLPYTEAERRGNAQDDALMRLCASTDIDAEIDAPGAIDLLRGL